MKRPIQSVEVSYLVHATEDQTKIRGAVGRIVGHDAEPEVERLEGHFGNEILKMTILLTGESAWNSFRSILSWMNAGVRQEVAEAAESYLDEHSAMFLRFDKQALLGGSLVLGSKDTVRMKVKPRAHLIRGGAPSFFRELIRGR